MAFITSSLEIRQRIRGRDRVALRPVVVLMTLEAAALRSLRRGMAGGAGGLIRQQDVRRLRARLRGVAARARHHRVRRVIERRARHPLFRDPGLGIDRQPRGRRGGAVSIVTFGAGLAGAS